MKYVEIVDGAHLAWFRVPDKIAHHVHAGSEVLYKNSDHGDDDVVLNGVVVRAIDGISDIDSSLRCVFGAKDECVLDSIKIPDRFKSSNPSSNKIKKRVEELYNDGQFNTKVIVNGDGLLVDGYTAYLVSKMFDRKTLTAYCIITGGEE